MIYWQGVNIDIKGNFSRYHTVLSKPSPYINETPDLESRLFSKRIFIFELYSKKHWSKLSLVISRIVKGWWLMATLDFQNLNFFSKDKSTRKRVVLERCSHRQTPLLGPNSIKNRSLLKNSYRFPSWKGCQISSPSNCWYQSRHEQDIMY